MFKLVVFCAVASLSRAQLKDSREAAILSDARYLQVNGQAGSQYSQEDGTNFKEETKPNGDRVGSYSYVDPSGQTRTISYTAGKDGFRATGDGVPVAPPPVAPLPQYNPPAQNWNQQPQQDWNQQQPAQNWNQQPAQNWNQNQYNAPAVTERNWDESPNNKWDQWDDPGTWNNEAATPAPAQQQQQWSQQQWTAPAQPQQPQPQWTAPAQPQQQQWNYNPQTTTPAPHRFYPPGRLNLNRMPDGFSYTFNKS